MGQGAQIYNFICLLPVPQTFSYIAMRILMSGSTPLCSPMSLSENYKLPNIILTFQPHLLLMGFKNPFLLTQISAPKLEQSGLSPWGFGTLLHSLPPAPLSSEQPVLLPTPTAPFLHGGWQLPPNVCWLFIYKGHDQAKLKIS